MWTSVQNIGSVLEDVPIKAVEGDECSIPDVYGKAIQFHLALKQDYNGLKNEREVNTWRGLITLLALQKYYDFPLVWKSVSMPTDENLLCDSLKFIPEHFSIFADPVQQWDGRTFHVLTWKKSENTSVDLFLYSPATLVYPVADWPSVFSQLPEIEWFDRENGFIAPESVLGESDKKIMAYWLGQTINMVQRKGERDNPSKQMVLGHLNQYLKDLHVNLTPKDLLSFRQVPINGNAEMSAALDALNYTVEVTLHFGNDRIPANRLFSDQICYFKNSEYDIFRMCSCRGNYQVDGEDNLYAFLPLNSDMRKYCGSFNLAAGVTMTCIRKGKKDKADYIRAQINLPDNVGLDLVKDYKMVQCATAKKGEAFSYFDNSLSNKPPLIAIWPNMICDIWKRYYVMLDDECKAGNLEVADSSELHRTSNKYVVQTNYVPDAIPLVLRYNSKGQDSQALSIGMISLHTSYISQDANYSVHADVAVDFGTSSTRVFAKIEGVPGKKEISIIDDYPLVVMTYGSEQNIMRNYFVAKQEASFHQGGNADCEKKIFSIYKRDKVFLKKTASPILDGVIYQAKADEKLEDQSGSYVNRLMANLKWGDKGTRPYYKAFLEQLCLHVMSLLYQEHQVRDITWKYALPEVMDPTSKDSIQSVWTGDINSYLKSMSDVITCTIAQGYETESNAASKYFLCDKAESANAEKGYLIMDIGGGSTDIALWQGTRGKCDMKWHDSVDVAGHSIFTRWVARCLNNFAALTSEETLKKMIAAVTGNVGVNGSNSAQNALVDRILTLYSPTLLAMYKQECDGGSAGHWAVELRRRIIHGVSILFFALGYQVGLLAKEHALKISDRPGTFFIAIGGRGAKILEWTDNACANGPTSQVFFDLGRRAAADGKFPTIKVQISQDPKSEVARGLLEDAKMDECLDAGSEDGQKLKKSAPKLDYLSLFLQFADEYRNVFGGLYPLPELTADSAEDMLNRYSGDRGSLINVFMQVLYECWAAGDHTGG